MPFYNAAASSLDSSFFTVYAYFVYMITTPLSFFVLCLHVLMTNHSKSNLFFVLGLQLAQPRHSKSTSVHDLDLHKIHIGTICCVPKVMNDNSEQ